jgi:hypothetical protein
MELWKGLVSGADSFSGLQTVSCALPRWRDGALVSFFLQWHQLFGIRAVLCDLT